MSYFSNGVDNQYEKKQQRMDLRSHGTSAEAAMWKILNRRQIDGLRFRRQYSMGPYIMDFYCPELRLCIELDGEVHFHPGAGQHDLQRTRYLESMGIYVVRYENYNVFQCPQSIIEHIKQTARELRLRKKEAAEILP